MALFRAYVVSDVPLKGRSEVIITNASQGPSKFSIRLKSSNWEYERMRSELELTVLHSFPVPPDRGTPCIAVINETLHRGLVLSTNQNQNTFNVCLVDLGCILKALSHNTLFQIPDEIMAYRLFSTKVALADGEALSQQPGLNEVFASLVLSLNHLMCEVVHYEGTHHIVNLFNIKRQNIAQVVLNMYNNLVPKLIKALTPAPPSSPKIEIPDPQLQPTEKLFVMVSHRIGHFFGQLLNRATSELTHIFNELRNFYEANPEAARLDVGSSLIGQFVVVKWSRDGQYYRSRVLNQTENCVEVELIDFGDIIMVSHRDLYAPVVSSRLYRPAFGINCLLSRDQIDVLKKEHWDSLLLKKSVEVRIVNKHPDGSYTVAFTIDPYNHKVLEALNPQTNPTAMKNPAAQPKPTKPSLQPPSTAFTDAPLQPQICPSQLPSTASEAVPISISYMNNSEEDSNAYVPPKKPLLRELNESSDIRTSTPARNPCAQDLVASPVVQEIVRMPRGLPIAESGSQKNVVQAEPAVHKTADVVQMVDRAASLILGIPVPTGTYACLDISHPRIKIAWFYSFERFFLTPMDVTIYEAELEHLNEFYATLSPNELVEERPKVGLPCVVKFKEDDVFYRSQIVAIFPNKTAQILFVDYGNEQLTSLADIKRILPKFMTLPQLVWQCKLAGVCGSQLRTGMSLSLDDEFTATLLAVDKGEHLVKITHKIHGDMASYVKKKSLLVLRPAASQLWDPEHKLCSDGYDVLISHVKSASEFWILLKADWQIVKDVYEELDHHFKKGASKVERPVVGQLYALELPDFGGYYRARVCSIEGKTVQAIFVDFGDTHTVSDDKFLSLPERLRVVPPLATCCSMSRLNWPLEAEKRFVMITSDPDKIFRALFQSASGKGIRIIDSLYDLSHDGKNIEQEIFSGIDAAPKEIHVPEPTPDVQKTIPRPTVADLFDPSIDMQTEHHEVYITHSKSPDEFYIQLMADEDIHNQVVEVLAQHRAMAPTKVEHPVVGQIVAVHHPVVGDASFRARVTTITGNTVEIHLVDYGDVIAIPIEKIFLPPPSLEALPPLAACCRMKSRDWSQKENELFVFLTSNSAVISRVSFGHVVSASVREVQAVFFNGKNIEEDISSRLDKQKSEPIAIELFKPVVEIKEAPTHQTDTDLRDHVGHDGQLRNFVNSTLVDERGKKEPIAKERQIIKIEQHFEIDSHMLDESFSSNYATPDGSVLGDGEEDDEDDSSNLDLLSVSMSCNNGEKETEDKQSASFPDFVDHPTNGLLNGAFDSQNDCKTEVGINPSP